MSAEYVRRTYGVDYKVGERLAVDGRAGVLVSFPGQYLGIRFDGDKHTSRAHPTWRVERVTPPAGRPRFTKSVGNQTVAMEDIVFDDEDQCIGCATPCGDCPTSPGGQP